MTKTQKFFLACTQINFFTNHAFPSAQYYLTHDYVASAITVFFLTINCSSNTLRWCHVNLILIPVISTIYCLYCFIFKRVVIISFFNPQNYCFIFFNHPVFCFFFAIIQHNSVDGRDSIQLF